MNTLLLLPSQPYLIQPYFNDCFWLLINCHYRAIDGDSPNERDHNSFSKPEQEPKKMTICNGITPFSFITANLKDFTYK